MGSIRADSNDVPLDGGLARRLGFGFDDNPYPAGTAASSAWRDDYSFAGLRRGAVSVVTD